MLDAPNNTQTKINCVKLQKKILMIAKLTRNWKQKCFYNASPLRWFLAVMHDGSIRWSRKWIKWQLSCSQVFYATRLKRRGKSHQGKKCQHKLLLASYFVLSKMHLWTLQPQDNPI